jgi:hypothetical protein
VAATSGFARRSEAAGVHSYYWRRPKDNAEVDLLLVDEPAAASASRSKRLLR